MSVFSAAEPRFSLFCSLTNLSVVIPCHTRRSCQFQCVLTRSEENESLLDVTFNALDLLSNDVEADSLGKGTALTDGHDITHLESESGRAMSGDGLVALLKSVVLAHVVEVIASHDDVPVHAGRDNDTPNF